MATIFHACSECSHVLSSDEEFCSAHPDAMIHSVREGAARESKGETYTISYGSDTATVEIGMPESPILVDGQQIGRQCAEGYRLGGPARSVEGIMRIVARHIWGREAAEGDGWDEIEYGPVEDETKTLVVDPDTVSMVLSDDEYTRERSRAAIDEIARRVEVELESRGLSGYAVEREYRTTGRRDDEDLPEVWEAVLIGQVNEIRAAVLGEVEGD